MNQSAYIARIGQALAVGDLRRAEVLQAQFEVLARTTADRWWVSHFATALRAERVRRIPERASA